MRALAPDQQTEPLAATVKLIGKLEERVAELEGGSSVDSAPDVRAREDKAVTEQPRSWYKKLPGTDVIGLGSALEGVGQLWASNHHMINGSTEGYIAGGVTVGVAGYTVAKRLVTKHYEGKDENSGD